MAKKGSAEFTGLDILKALYSELSAPVLPYYKTLVRVHLAKGGSYEDTVVHTSENHAKLVSKGHRGARNVQELRRFTEYTCGSLYAPVSNLGYRQMDYETALNFKIDCDLARKKTGDITDGAVHYIAKLVSGDGIMARRETLVKYSARSRPPAKSNSQDLEERYGNDKSLSTKDKDDLMAWIEVNREALDDPNNEFKHEAFLEKVLRSAVSISAGPDDLDDESFLDWLTRSESSATKTNRKPEME